MNPIYENMFDAIKRAENILQIVTKGDLRKYYRFRPARFYGGIATADCVGCCLACIFCWSWNQVTRPAAYGKFYSPEDVAGRLTNIARKKGFDQVRISGNEPTISREHLLEVLKLIPDDILFILETNGILIGSDQTYARDLSRFRNLYVRVSLKGTTKEEFSRLTGASPEGFLLQLKAIENLWRFDVNVQPAAMVSFSPLEKVNALKKRLGEIAPQLRELEIEELVLYGNIKDRLEKAGIVYRSAYKPKDIPSEQI